MSKYALLIHGDDATYTEITPRLRLRNYGSWLISEKIQQDRISKERSRQLLAIVQLAKRISIEKGVSVDEAFVLINSADAGENANITADYIEEVSQIVESAAGQTQSDAKILTLFLKSRAEGLISESWERLADWCDDDTYTLDDKTRERIVAFINQEQVGGSEAADADDEDDADEKASEGNEKKSSVSGSKSKSTASESSSKEMTGTAATQGSPLVA